MNDLERNRSDRHRRLVATTVIGLLTQLSACSVIPPQKQYSQAQLNAIETREVEASSDETYRAATNALFDAGYTIAMSDKSAGLITGSKAKDRSTERFWVDPTMQDTRFLVSMQVLPVDARRSSVRMKTSINGEPYVDEQAINQLWVLMQRQVLMKEPLAVDATSP